MRFLWVISSEHVYTRARDLVCACALEMRRIRNAKCFYFCRRVPYSRTFHVAVQWVFRTKKTVQTASGEGGAVNLTTISKLSM